MKATIPSGECVRLRLTIRGAVQGVGFRPYAYRLATELGLAGWVNNSSQGVFVEIEGDRSQVEEFLLRVESERPPLAAIHSLESSVLDACGDQTFEIRTSQEAGEPTALVLPDVATCRDCRREIFDPGDRRYRYPFTNCTHCGPRFSIIEALPYDRPQTTMRRFSMCDACRAEYEDPRDRRFHAQPNACAECGPHLELWSRNGEQVESHLAALREAAFAVRAGKIVAVKGLGGFHLMVDARNDPAMRRLRRLKHREEKPFAVMVPSLGFAEEYCVISVLERRLLCSPEAPIVLLHRRGGGSRIAPEVAPGNPYLGVMLPYTPLHHLLLADLDFPVVATSGNLSDEPICTDEREALERLGGIADLFLIHDRPIARHVDDSVVRIVAGREMVMRRARGYAPLPIDLRIEHPPGSSVLALGAHLKNNIALSAGDQVFVSQHIGDLETAQAFSAFERVIGDFERMREIRPSMVACDAHPVGVKAKGGELRIVYSPLDALQVARQNPSRQVVFFAVGFETTAPANAMAVYQAGRLGIGNFSILVSHVLVPPAMEAILSSPGNRVQGFLAAGHVCTVMGYTEYEPVARKYRVPIVVTGFEPLDILQGAYLCIKQLEDGRAEVENQYTRAVRRRGNEAAQQLIREVFRVVPRQWRGVGEIPRSGLGLREPYAEFDAEARFGVAHVTARESSECISGLVLQGLKKPNECRAFGTRCTPERPLGATMVSSEGACAAYYRYRKRPASLGGETSKEP